jgi:hydroxymethylbilane synthase
MPYATTTLRLGTRGSPLALAQAHLVRDALIAADPYLVIEIVPVIATGDRIQDRSLADIGGKALWTKELDHHLMTGEIDFAVHSMKDVETVRPDTLVIAAMLKRADVRDRIVGADSVQALPVGATIGTSAPRRTAQLLRARPDLNIVLFRGNVQTRLRKLAEGEVAATLLAAAGLERLGMSDGTALSVDDWLPAPSQGAVGIETLAENQAVRAILSAIDDAETHACVKAERALLAGLNAGCRSPVAALARMEGDVITLRAEILTMDGSETQVGSCQLDPSDQEAPRQLAAQLLDAASPALRSLFG